MTLKQINYKNKILDEMKAVYDRGMARASRRNIEPRDYLKIIGKCLNTQWTKDNFNILVFIFRKHDDYTFEEHDNLMKLNGWKF